MSTEKISSLIVAITIATLIVTIVIAPNYIIIPGFGYYDGHRLVLLCAQYLAMLSLCVTLYFQPVQSTQEKDSNNKNITLSITLLTLILLSISLAGLPRFALIEGLNFAGLGALALTIGLHNNTLLNKRYISNITLITFASSLGLYTLIFMVYYFAALSTQLTLDASVMFHGFSNYRFFNQMQVWMLPLLMLPLLIKLSGGNWLARYRLLFSALICINIILLIFSSARGASLALLVSSLIVLLLIKPIALRLLLKLSLLAAVAFALYWLMFVVVPPYFGFTITDSIRLRTDSSYRFELWLICLDMIKQSPLFGMGPMAFAATPNGFGFSHPHNSVLQLAAEWGLIATVIVLFFYTKGLMAFWRLCIDQSVASERRMYRVSLLWSLLAASIYSLFSGVIVMPMSQLLGALIIGLMLAEYRSSKIASPQQVITLTTPIKSVLAIALLVFAGLYAWLLWPQIYMRMADDQSYITNLTNTGPRFWQEGGVALEH